MEGEAISKSLHPKPCLDSNPPVAKKKRSLPGTPDPDAEVLALSPKTLLATNRFLCEICGKGFQRDQNLQLHRRGHNLPWRLKQRSGKDPPRKRVYVCPEKSCVHHHPSRALGDLTGIKKHFCRKHGEKKWKCEKCSKRYAVQSDWKAHSKTCGTREYRCDCGTLFSRRDSFVTHRAFCDALAEETARVSAATGFNGANTGDYQLAAGLIRSNILHQFSSTFKPILGGGETADPAGLSLWMGQARNTMNSSNPMYGDYQFANLSNPQQQLDYPLNWMYGGRLSSPGSRELSSTLLPASNDKEADVRQQPPVDVSVPSLYSNQLHQHQAGVVTDMSATALLQKAAMIGVTTSSAAPSFMGGFKMKPCSFKINIEEGIKNDGLLINPSHCHPCMDSLDRDEITVSDPFEMYNSTARRCQQDDMGGGGETRDFLGVGVQSTLCPSSIDGWI